MGRPQEYERRSILRLDWCNDLHIGAVSKTLLSARTSEAGPPSESVMIPPGNAVRFLPKAPVSDVEFGVPPRDTEDRGCNRYLWVIDTRGIPYLIERPMSVLGRKLPKHTNLTGGGPAYIGGELWFAGTRSMFVSGGSGRFPPLGEDQLSAAVAVFSSFSYVVTSLGWDSAAGRAMRVLQEH